MKKVRQQTIEHWGKRLSASLSDRQISFRRAASIAGVAPSVIDSWSSGRSPSDLVAVKRLATHMGVSFSWLLTGEIEDIQNLDVSHLFDSPKVIFDGYLKVKIEKMAPRKTRK